MPTKKKSKKVAPAKKVNEAKLRKLADKALEDFKASSQARYDKAMLVYNEQDNETQDALDRMIDQLSEIARRHMWVAFSNNSDSRMVLTLPDQVIRQNMTYMAVQILKDLSQMDVKVANFRFPDTLCAVCFRPTKKRKKVKS